MIIEKNINRIITIIRRAEEQNIDNKMQALQAHIQIVVNLDKNFLSNIRSINQNGLTENSRVTYSLSNI